MADPIALRTLADFVQATVTASPDRTITGVSNLELAGPDDLSFVADARFAGAAERSQAAAFVVAKTIPSLTKPQLVVAEPAYAFARLVSHFFVPPYRALGIAEPIDRGHNAHTGADVSIGPFVSLGDETSIGDRVTLAPGVQIGHNCEIGDDSVLHANVVVRDGCRIGQRVVIHSGTVIGSDGFGYVQHQGTHVKMPQLGGVTIEDDVEIGANVTIDRATFGQTIIRKGTKIDNLVQIAHNVQIGPHAIVVAQVGIAGSTTVGSHVMIGGQAGLADHIQVADRVMIGARSGVTRSLASDQIVSGAPAMPHETALRAQSLIPLLPELRQQIRDLQKRVEALSALRSATTRTRRKAESKAPVSKKLAARKQSRKTR
ncbi:MAG: UDP-3-O-(3-hydroxymyristoyl)glucosamine N-acyltransferase [Nitrospiraceae bacterium]